MAQANPVKITFPDQTVKEYPTLSKASISIGHNPDYISTKLMEGKYHNQDGFKWNPQQKTQKTQIELTTNHPVEITAPDGSIHKYRSQLEASIALGKNSNYLANQLNQGNFSNRDGYSWKVPQKARYNPKRAIKVTFPNKATKIYPNKSQASLAMGYSRNYIDQATKRGVNSNQEGCSWEFLQDTSNETNSGPNPDANSASTTTISDKSLPTHKKDLLLATNMYEQLLDAGLASTTAQEAISTQLQIPNNILTFYFKGTNPHD